MLEMIHKILYTGIGLAAMTEQKAKEIAEDLEKRGELSSEEGKKLTQELIDKARKQTEHLKKTINDEVDKIANKCGWVRQQEIEDLKRRLEQLENRVPPTSAPATSPDDSL